MPQRHDMEAVMRAVAFAAAMLLAGGALGAARASHDIRFAKQAGTPTAELQFACPMEYLTHWTDELELRVRVELGPDCATELGAGMRSELYDPPSGRLAGVRQVVFDTQGRIATITVQLERAADLRVSQGRLRNVVRIEFRPPASDSPQTASAPPPPTPTVAPPPAATNPAAPRSSETPARAPLRLVQRPPERTERFAIQLAAGASVAENASALASPSGGVLYVKERVAGERQWQELRLGFFDSEHDARVRADSLLAAFPNALVVIADTSEQDSASAAPLRSSVAAAEPESQDDAPALSPERVAALIAEAGEAMSSQNYDRAVQIYSRLLEEPGLADRRLARERLGIARERKGQRAQATHEYEAYLAEFSDGPDADRVRQRLAGLTAAALPGEVTASARVPQRYELSGGVAQYLRHDVYTPLDDRPERDVQSTLLSTVDLVLKRHGERFQLQSRIDATYGYNLSDETEGVAPADRDQLYVSNAYIDVADTQRGWSGRLGRQTVYGSGIFGRFDGVHADYRWRPRVALNLEIGRPVEYLRRAIDARRQFAAFSADLDGLVHGWDFSLYSLAQQIDGIADRQAVGAEARHRGDAWNVVGSVDVDPSYGVLNSAIVSANWRLKPKLTLNGRFNIGTAPFLTTRNALIGQQVATIEALLDTYTEGQVRHLARDRTAQVRNGTIGLVKPLFSRFQLNVNVDVFDFDATIASGGVAAMPRSRQNSLYMAFVGSSIAKQGDAAVFSLRHTDSTTATGDTVIVEFRLPATSRLRLSPRLALSHRAYKDGSDQTIVAPMFRAAYRWPHGHQLELEVGKELANRDFLPTQLPLFGQPIEQSSANFFNAGYWWGF